MSRCISVMRLSPWTAPRTRCFGASSGIQSSSKLIGPFHRMLTRMSIFYCRTPPHTFDVASQTWKILGCGGGYFEHNPKAAHFSCVTSKKGSCSGGAQVSNTQTEVLGYLSAVGCNAPKHHCWSTSEGKLGRWCWPAIGFRKGNMARKYRLPV